MQDENFEEMDRSLMKDLKTSSKAPVPPGILKGFSASVVEKIREEEPAQEIYRPVRTAVWLAPTFAVLVLASLVVWRAPLWQSAASKPAAVIQLASTVSTISAEVAALRELGAWTDEDDASSGIPVEIG